MIDGGIVATAVQDEASTGSRQTGPSEVSWVFNVKDSCHTTNIVSELYGIVFGTESQLEPVYERLRQLGIEEPDQVDRTIENITGKPSRARKTSYRQRRKELLLALLDDYTDDVDRAAEEIGTFFDHLRQVGIRGLVAERLNDDEYMHRPPQRHKPKRAGPQK